MIEFDCCIPENAQKSLSNGTIRIQLDVDKTQCHIIPQLIENVEHMMHVIMVTHEEAAQIANKKQNECVETNKFGKTESLKTTHQKLLTKYRMLKNRNAEAKDQTFEEYSSWFKSTYHPNVESENLTEEALSWLCKKLEE